MPAPRPRVVLLAQDEREPASGGDRNKARKILSHPGWRAEEGEGLWPTCSSGVCARFLNRMRMMTRAQGSRPKAGCGQYVAPNSGCRWRAQTAGGRREGALEEAELFLGLRTQLAALLSAT
jgi:hypothetical protein